jgi:hypothetical protein
MLADTQTLGTTPVAFARRMYAGNKSQFVPNGDTPVNERKLVVAHEAQRNGNIKTLVGLSHVLPDPSSTNGATRALVANVTITRPPYATATQTKLVVDQLVTALAATKIDQYFNQEQ